MILASLTRERVPEIPPNNPVVHGCAFPNESSLVTRLRRYGSVRKDGENFLVHCSLWYISRRIGSGSFPRRLDEISRISTNTISSGDGFDLMQVSPATNRLFAFTIQSSV